MVRTNNKFQNGFSSPEAILIPILFEKSLVVLFIYVTCYLHFFEFFVCLGFGG